MSAPASLMGFARSSAKNGAVHLDMVTIALVLAITLLGLVMVTSASVSIASQESGQPFYYLERQLFLTLIGAACAALVFSVPTELLEKASVPLLAIAIGLLIVVLVPGLGHSVNGSRRWLRLAGANFQVSELARVLVLIYIASYAVRREAELTESAMGLVKPLALLFFVSALLLIEPDFGAATVLFATGFGLLFLAGARLRYVIAMTALALAGFGLLAVSSSYRMRRLTAFLDPWASKSSAGFQAVQGQIALGSGGLLGVGLGKSVQKIYYLPEAQTDFILAVIGEELGVLGITGVVVLYGMIAYAGLRTARRAVGRYAKLLATGLTSLILCQGILNIFVVLGIAPLTGVPLPFISYAPTNLCVMLAAVGVLLNISRPGARRLKVVEVPERDAAADRDRRRRDRRARRAGTGSRRRAAS